jgi:hypothetical protein
MRLMALIVAMIVALGADAAAQSPDSAHPERAVSCPPGADPSPPKPGGDDPKPLSDKLAETKGVICPPAGLDREMQLTPPKGGELKVIPPPGGPGADQSVQPK